MKTILLLLLFALAGNCGAQVVVSPPPPAGTSGKPYSHQFVATGGTAPYTWAAGGLPGGIVMDSSTGIISGTGVSVIPPETFNIWVTATDKNGTVGTLTTTLTLKDPMDEPQKDDGGPGGCTAWGSTGLAWSFVLILAAVLVPPFGRKRR